VWGGISLFGAGPTLFNASFDNVTVGARDQAMNILEGSITMRNSSLRNTFNAQFCLNLYGSVTSPVSLIEGTEIANCTTGIRMNQGTLRLSNNVITGNGTGLSLTSAAATAITFRNNVFAGNGVDGAPSLAASLK
jgi:nitrous oxidase accessory protein NosD